MSIFNQNLSNGHRENKDFSKSEESKLNKSLEQNTCSGLSFHLEVSESCLEGLLTLALTAFLGSGFIFAQKADVLTPTRDTLILPGNQSELL